MPLELIFQFIVFLVLLSVCHPTGVQREVNLGPTIHVFGISDAMNVKWDISKENLSPSIFSSPLITKEIVQCMSETHRVYVFLITHLNSLDIHYKRKRLHIRV